MFAQDVIVFETDSATIEANISDQGIHFFYQNLDGESMTIDVLQSNLMVIDSTLSLKSILDEDDGLWKIEAFDDDRFLELKFDENGPDQTEFLELQKMLAKLGHSDTFLGGAFDDFDAVDSGAQDGFWGCLTSAASLVMSYGGIFSCGAGMVPTCISGLAGHAPAVIGTACSCFDDC